jgi:DNA-binding NarL/FixJ family response regulator
MKVLIVDDHPLIRESLACYLAEIGSVSVSEAEDFVSAVAAIFQRPDFDLVVLDIRMPGVDGFTTLVMLRRLFPYLRVALLSESGTPVEMRRALENGAVGYLPKSMDRLPLVNALRLLLSDEKFFPAEIVQPAASYAQEGSVADESRLRSFGLTSRQKAVLTEVAKGKSNREIGQVLCISEITVKMHVHAVCQKLTTRNRRQAVERARSLGLISGSGIAEALESR